jgi:small-conductance mechanosensitive channel
MMTFVPETPLPRRPLFWRVVHVVAGVALFLYALRVLPPMPLQRGALVLIAALLAAGSMALTDSLVGVVAGFFEKTQKGGTP